MRTSNTPSQASHCSSSTPSSTITSSSSSSNPSDTSTQLYSISSCSHFPEQPTYSSDKALLKPRSESEMPPGYSKPRGIMRVVCGHMRCQLDLNNLCANFAQDELMPNYAGVNHCRDRPPPPQVPGQTLTVLGDVRRLKRTTRNTSVEHTTFDPALGVPVHRMMPKDSTSTQMDYRPVAEEDEEMLDASSSDNNIA